ncbi:MAG: hypothetical protein EXS30_00325 [Pedosphaera sp.]|nr:hypothetical protein [Pedosphaera sp.]
MLPFSLVVIRDREWIKPSAWEPTIYFVVVCCPPTQTAVDEKLISPVCLARSGVPQPAEVY